MATAVNSAAASLVVYRNVMIPMRDGTRLATDIYLPSTDGREPAPGRFPVLLSRTPYGKSRNIEPARFTERGYALAIQDKRGRNDSEGIYRLLMDDGWGPHRDGYDTIAWLSRQPWCSGQVGMFGNSYLGFTTISAASTRPAALVAALCSQPSSDLFTDRTFLGGALGDIARWNASAFVAADLIAKMPEPLREIARAEHQDYMNNPQASQRLPLTDVAFQRLIPQLWADALAAWDDPAFFAESAVGPDRLASLQVPVLHVGGWYDPFLRNSLRQFAGASSLPSEERVRSGQRLIVGAWTHGGFASDKAGETVFPDLAIDYAGLVLDWHDRWLRGQAPARDSDPRVLLYVMGVNRWRAEDAWPLEDAAATPYYLHSAGAANTATGNGRLDAILPSDEAADHYTYDPRDPVPSPAVTAGRNDLARYLSRSDALVYTSEPLSEALEVTGPISATIYADSSAQDTDWTVELHDVDPEGHSFMLTDGILRARYRYSRTEPQPLTPGTVERYEIDLRATSSVFQPGHAIRLVVSSSKFPYYDRHPNAYVNLAAATEKDWVAARQTIHHSVVYPSCVTLPIVPRGRHQRWVDNPKPLPATRDLPKPADLPASALKTA